MNFRIKYLPLLLFTLTIYSQEKLFMKGADLSYLPALESNGAVFYDNGVAKDALEIFRDHGFNCIRIRLWHTPYDFNSSISTVLELARRVKTKGFRFLLDIHYSDTWADPGKQTKPLAWKDLSFPILLDSVYCYTYDVIRALKNDNVLPDIVQIGNEISNGFLWDDGRIDGTPAQWTKFSQLLSAGIRGVKECLAPEDSVRIMIHIDNGGVSNAIWFFDNLAKASISFDIIGLSYYPWWQGNLQRDSLLIDQLARSYPQDIVIAETAYPWTLDGKDAFANTVNQQSQLLSQYPASIEGQFNFFQDLYSQVKKTPGGKGTGLFYWEPDWVSAPGMGSPMENMAMFDFSGNVLPAFDVFRRALHYAIAPEPRTVDFGNVERGETGDNVCCMLRNIFYTPATIESIALQRNNPFTLINLPLFPLTLRPSDSLRFNIMFSRTEEGVFRDTIHVYLSDSTFFDVQITASGKVISKIGPATAGILYATSRGATEGRLHSLNTMTGAIDTIGTLGVSEIEGMAIRPSDKAIYGTHGTSTATSLYRISGASGDAIQANTIPVANISCIVFSTLNTLYGATTTGALYRIDPMTGAAAFVGSSPGLSYTGLSFSPLSGKLWATTRVPCDSIYTIDTENGVASAVGSTGLFAINLSLSFNSAGALYALIDNGSGEDYLATVDTLTGIPTLVSDNALAVKNLRAMAMISVLTSVDIEQKRLQPQSYALSQNYPNPFNPTTVISYQIPLNPHLQRGNERGIYVTLKIFDLLGREVATLVNEKKDAGYYSVQWNASGFSSGIYFYQLQANEKREIKKMILMK